MIIRSSTIKHLLTTLFVGSLLILLVIFSANSQETTRVLSEESQQCLKCHGNANYTLSNEESEDEVVLKMYQELRIDPVKLINSTHGHFKCTDCHSSDYETTPHPVSVKFETNYACLDCHGGDEAYASYKFETIEEEYNLSVHAKVLGNSFSCWSCHNPHYYTHTGNNSISERVANDNQMCLQCHGNEIRFNDLTDKELPILINKHDWLPNQALHFSKVRCIDCHAANNDSILVAHNIMPSANAVKNCVECHSKNSILVSSLYKHVVSTERTGAGFYNGVILNEGYLIGANRNYYLNVASIVIFGLTLFAIAIHIIFRKRKSAKNASK